MSGPTCATHANSQAALHFHAHPTACKSAREAVRSLLAAGVRGTFDAFARQAGVPDRLASQTLRHLCLEQAAAVHGVHGERRVGRPRVIYGPPHTPSLDALSFARQVWR